MERIDIGFKLAVGGVAAIWGGLSVLVQVLLILMVLDIATGFLAGFINRELSSDVSFRGMAKKSVVLLVVAGGAWVEPAVGLPVGEAVAGFYAAHEGVSLIENVARAGLPVPQVLRDALAKLSPDVTEKGTSSG